MDIRIIVGLEAHDGSGKSTTAVEISKLFGGSVFFTNEQIKKKRSGIYKDDSNEQESDSSKETEEDALAISADASDLATGCNGFGWTQFITE